MNQNIKIKRANFKNPMEVVTDTVYYDYLRGPDNSSEDGGASAIAFWEKLDDELRAQIASMSRFPVELLIEWQALVRRYRVKPKDVGANTYIRVFANVHFSVSSDIIQTVGRQFMGSKPNNPGMKINYRRNTRYSNANLGLREYYCSDLASSAKCMRFNHKVERFIKKLKAQVPIGFWDEKKTPISHFYAYCIINLQMPTAKNLNTFNQKIESEKEQDEYMNSWIDQNDYQDEE